MNFKSMFMGAATAVTLTATALVAAPAQAATITPGSQINFASPGFPSINGGGVQRTGNTLNFFGFPLTAGNQGTSVTSGTGSFRDSHLVSSTAFPLPRIQDLTLTATVSPNIFTSGPVANFITGFDIVTARFFGLPVSSDPASFDLSSFVYNALDGSAAVNGTFRSGLNSIFGSGTFTSQLGTGGSLPAVNPSSYSLSLTAVPTPALLPGLVAFGVGVLRKRKSVGVAESDA